MCITSPGVPCHFTLQHLSVAGACHLSTCVPLQIDQDGSVTIVAPTLESLTATEAHIATTIADITPGVTYR